MFKEGYMRNAPKKVSNLRPKPPAPIQSQMKAMNGILEYLDDCSNKPVDEISINIETTILEDGSIWYRINDSKSDGEWIKLESNTWKHS